MPLSFFALREAQVLAIVDYDAGNLRSVQRACRKVGLTAEIVADPRLVESAERIIFPGVGAATSAVDTLKERGLEKTTGIVSVSLREYAPVLNRTIPP
jgi:imidazoleglycerol phosphate synthase glutamine amidotransferase subunit HisH